MISIQLILSGAGRLQYSGSPGQSSLPTTLPPATNAATSLWTEGERNIFDTKAELETNGVTVSGSGSRLPGVPGHVPGTGGETGNV